MYFRSEIIQDNTNEKRDLEFFPAFFLHKELSFKMKSLHVYYKELHICKIILLLDNDDVYLNLVYYEDMYLLNDQNKLFFVQYMTEYCIKNYKCRRLYICEGKKLIEKELSQSLFYPKGKKVMKLIDQDRLKLDDDCFDDYGYIVNQFKMDGISFGASTTRKSGCGWIATYNLLRYLGKEKYINEVIKDLSKLGFRNKLFGENFFVIVYYLKKCGLKPQIRPMIKTSIINKMEDSECGIILYVPGKNAHYAMYHKNGDRFRFLNAEYGNTNLNITISFFFQKYQKAPFQYLIYIPALSERN